jgi:hypothetical protein
VAPRESLAFLVTSLKSEGIALLNPSPFLLLSLVLPQVAQGCQAQQAPAAS